MEQFGTIVLVIRMECIFCKIVDGKMPSYKIYEDDSILAFLDINPVSAGHTLIIPKKHTLDINTIDNNTLVKIFDKARDISKKLISNMDADGFTLTQNNGDAQEVKHFHLHIIPKYNKSVKMSIEEVYDMMTR